MRGKADYQSQIYYAIDIESLDPEDYPLRAVKQRADEVLGSMRKEFDGTYSRMGRPSIPPEMLLKALLLQALHSIRSERQLVEQIKMNLLYRWFIDLSLDAPVWDPTSFRRTGSGSSSMGCSVRSSTAWRKAPMSRSGRRAITSRSTAP